MKIVFAFLFAVLICIENPVSAQKSAGVPLPILLTYADVADLALPAPIVAQVRIRKAAEPEYAHRLEPQQ
mgnify:CR=1 FL=1